MKILILLLTAILFLISTLKGQSKVDTLTNAEIITLSKIGLQPSVIINKIHSSYTAFDVSTDAIINLSQNGVAAEVINEMMELDNQQKSAINAEINYKDPKVMHKAGIYYYNPGNENEPLKKIQVVRISSIQTSSGGYGGFGGSSRNAILAGAASKQLLSDNYPVFYFYFNYDDYSRADWFGEATSPNEFALVKVIVKKEQRMFNVGGSSYAGYGGSSSSGIPEKNKIPFDFEEISEGIYRVTFKTPLEKGEYCFVYASDIDKIFDFGIK